MSFTTVEDVKQYTGVKPGDVGFADSAELDAWLESRFPEIEDLINVHVFGTDDEAYWDDGNVPAGVRKIALDMMRNTVMLMVVSRETPVVNIGDFRARVTEPDIFTESIRTALDLYKGTAGSVSKPSWSTSVRMFRVRREDEMPDA